MKQLFILYVVIAVISTSCNSAQSEAQKQADLIEKTMMKNSPAAVVAAESGAYLTARIDGKEWSATTIIPNNNTSSNTKLVRGERNKDMIQFQLWKPSMVAGKKKAFSEASPAGIYLENDPALFSGNSGEVEITKMNNEWVEGVFHFKATGILYDASGNSSKRMIEVTDGRFRVQTQ